ncbi:hypothetical protein HHL19_14430 [Streptomyces sp. R302]|uniref:bestrophin-like domain n=1 Tax=unclassified Streptomyces TaxID=2593676 RepID=UPI00145FA456|nr:MULTISPECIES: hypothetical protein [unclassified Streptomyces]NML51268.1 hypothetical protein [Streptomyces sp. R301]NML79846.1 hypothetical protein [Streptomyces sp. R302]
MSPCAGGVRLGSGPGAARPLPPPVRAGLDAAPSEYVHAVVDEQWPLTRAGVPHYGATERSLVEAFEVLRAYGPEGAREEVFHEEAVAHLDDVAAQRRARITMAERELPPPLQVLASGGALVLVPPRRSASACCSSFSLSVQGGLAVPLPGAVSRPFGRRRMAEGAAAASHGRRTGEAGREAALCRG